MSNKFEKHFQFVLQAYGLQEKMCKIKSLGSGLINQTWKITTSENEYVLQCINQSVFEQPLKIARNTRLIADYLIQIHPDYFFVAPVPTINAEDMLITEDGFYFRLFPFVSGSHAKVVLKTPEEALEAAQQFGRFTKLLNVIDISKFELTLPGFHDLELRYLQFLNALENGNKNRIRSATDQLDYLTAHTDLVTTFKNIKANPDFKQRITHHDTKISNVLFNKNDKAICVIDMDTVMPGYFISDLGDMMRTYLSPVSEEEQDFSKIMVREDFYKAITEGYNSEMKEELTAIEKNHFFYAGKFMIYMQALRFMTDHLNNDRYYGAKYEGHNFVRACNQLVLLQRLMEKENSLGE